MYMNDFFTQFQKEAQKIRLSPQEKGGIRALLRERFAGQAHPTRSPYFFFFTLRSFSEGGSFQFVHIRAMQVVAAFLLVVLLSGSTVYAAQGALPGDVLYPVKINVNEQVELTLATTEIAKAQVETRFAERRVAEAQELEAEGRLDATTTDEIERHFDEHASRALELSGSSREGQNVFVPAVTTLKQERATPESSTSVPSASVITERSHDERDVEDIPTLLEKQRGIFSELKQRVRRHHEEIRGIESGGGGENSRSENKGSGEGKGSEDHQED